MSNRARSVQQTTRQIARQTALSLGVCFCAAVGADNDPFLLGDWGGARTRLAEQGIDFDIGYVSEIAHNASGGRAKLTRYTDQWKLGATFDFDKLWNWPGASFQLVITDRNGRDLGADAEIGNNQLLQEVYGRGQTWHLTIFAFEQKFRDGKIDWRIGRLPVGEEIDSFSCDFQNLTFCGAQPGNIVGDYWVNWPTSQWATRVKFRTTKETYAQIAMYQLNPDYVDDSYARHEGLSLDNPGTNGWLVPLEAGWTPQPNGLAGLYKVGVWFNTAGGDDLFYDVDHEPRALTDAAPLRRDSRRGAYLSFQQQLSGRAAGDGLLVFFNATQADRETSATDRQIALGLEYRGPFDRPDDFIGFAVGATRANSYAAAYQRLFNTAHADTSSPIRDGNETVSEVFYNWSPLHAINVRPNVQYVVHPGGSAQNSNALVFGLKTIIAI